MKDLKNKVAVVTGGASGVGFSIAKALASEGVHVLVADINEEQAASAASEIQKIGPRATSMACDMSDHEMVERLADYATDEFGHVDIVCWCFAGSSDIH